VAAGDTFLTDTPDLTAGELLGGGEGPDREDVNGQLDLPAGGQ